MLMSRTYPPSAVLAPYVARHYIFSTQIPDELELTDQLLSENAFIRLLQHGDWSAEVEPGKWRAGQGAILFGSNIRPMRVRVRGNFHVIGVAIRPCGWRALFNQPASEFSDRMLSLTDIWGNGVEYLNNNISPLTDDCEIISKLETELIRRLEHIGSWQIDPIMRAFESIVHRNSTLQIKDVARQLGLSERQFERQCLASFGHTPKLVLRRSRFLDMATALRGLGDPSDEHLAELRYFDQSHRNREFRKFIGMTPHQFIHTPTPLFTAGLQFRLERKSELDEN